MKFVTAKIQCPGCKLNQKQTFKKPALFSPTILQFKCETCESDVLARITAVQKVHNTSDEDRVRVQAKITHASDLLVRLQAEEAEHNQKEPEA